MRGRAWSCGGVLLLVVAAVSGCASAQPDLGASTTSTPNPASTLPSASPAATVPATPSAEPSAEPAAAARTAPTRITIPAIDIDSRITPVGTEDRVLQIPEQPWVVGWWRDGVGHATDRGTVVLVAHLDSRRYGTGPFARARELERGDVMTLNAGPGQGSAYTVAAVRTYLKTALPYERLFRQDGPPRVVLVTCGGQYRPDSGWDSNVVIEFTPRRELKDERRASRMPATPT